MGYNKILTDSHDGKKFEIRYNNEKFYAVCSNVELKFFDSLSEAMKHAHTELSKEKT